MARIYGKPQLDIKFAFVCDEAETRALDALAGYGDDDFIEVFYSKLGAAYMREHEGGLRSFLKSIREQVPHVLYQMDQARKAFEKDGK